MCRSRKKEEFHFVADAGGHRCVLPDSTVCADSKTLKLGELPLAWLDRTRADCSVKGL